MTPVCGTRQAARPLATGGSPRAGTRAALWCAGIALAGFAADAAGKTWALAALRDGHRITVAGGLVRLQLVINHGAAFGVAAGFGPILAAASLTGVVLLGLWANRASGRAERFGAALAAGGAAGNLLDRLARPPAVLHGGVVDWIHVWFYGPTFNLADVWLRGGLLAAAGAWLWRHRHRPQVSEERRDTRPVRPKDF
jgi:signal peptidase II